MTNAGLSEFRIYIFSKHARRVHVNSSFRSRQNFFFSKQIRRSPFRRKTKKKHIVPRFKLKQLCRHATVCSLVATYINNKIFCRTIPLPFFRTTCKQHYCSRSDAVTRDSRLWSWYVFASVIIIITRERISISYENKYI